MHTKSGSRTLALAFGAALSLAASIAFAAPGGGGGGGGGGGSSGGGGGSSGGGGGGTSSSGGGSNGMAPIVCREGFVYSDEEKICVRQQTMNDRDLFQQGRALALAGHHERALDILTAVRDRNDAALLTMIGYATRKLGRVDEGIAIYHEALAIDPDNLDTHEYLGEGYLAAGRFDLAEVELDTLGRLCGTSCEQYVDLERAIAGDPGWN